MPLSAKSNSSYTRTQSRKRSIRVPVDVKSDHWASCSLAGLIQAFPSPFPIVGDLPSSPALPSTQAFQELQEIRVCEAKLPRSTSGAPPASEERLLRDFFDGFQPRQLVDGHWGRGRVSLSTWRSLQGNKKHSKEWSSQKLHVEWRTGHKRLQIIIKTKRKESYMHENICTLYYVQEAILETTASAISYQFVNESESYIFWKVNFSFSAFWQLALDSPIRGFFYIARNNCRHSVALSRWCSGESLSIGANWPSQLLPSRAPKFYRRVSEPSLNFFETICYFIKYRKDIWKKV